MIRDRSEANHLIDRKQMSKCILFGMHRSPHPPVILVQMVPVHDETVSAGTDHVHHFLVGVPRVGILAADERGKEHSGVELGEEGGLDESVENKGQISLRGREWER